MHGEPLNAPMPLLVNVTVPVGIRPISISVSLTRAVQIVAEPKVSEPGVQPMMVVEVARRLMATVVCSVLGLWVESAE